LSSSARRACSISWFLRSTFDVLLGQLLRLLRELLVGLLQLLLLRLQLAASCCDCFSRPSVCIVASIVFRTIRCWP
jgi:hypothetical protein